MHRLLLWQINTVKPQYNVPLRTLHLAYCHKIFRFRVQLLHNSYKVPFDYSSDSRYHDKIWINKGENQDFTVLINNNGRVQVLTLDISQGQRS